MIIWLPPVYSTSHLIEFSRFWSWKSWEHLPYFKKSDTCIEYSFMQYILFYLYVTYILSTSFHAEDSVVSNLIIVVSLDNGYKPVMITNETSSCSDTESVESDESSECDSEEEIENQKSKLWCLIALTISILRCALFLFCLGACFVIFVIFTHEDSSG